MGVYTFLAGIAGALTCFGFAVNRFYRGQNGVGALLVVLTPVAYMVAELLAMFFLLALAIAVALFVVVAILRGIANS